MTLSPFSLLLRSFKHRKMHRFFCLSHSSHWLLASTRCHTFSLIEKWVFVLVNPLTSSGKKGGSIAGGSCGHKMNHDPWFLPCSACDYPPKLHSQHDSGVWMAVSSHHASSSLCASAGYAGYRLPDESLTVCVSVNHAKQNWSLVPLTT